MFPPLLEGTGLSDWEVQRVICSKAPKCTVLPWLTLFPVVLVVYPADSSFSGREDDRLRRSGVTRSTAGAGRRPLRGEYYEHVARSADHGADGNVAG